MPSNSRSAAQVKRDKAALKKLAASGYSGKIDLRKPPTPYQLKKIAALKAKRASKKPAKRTIAKTVKGLFASNPKRGKKNKATLSKITKRAKKTASKVTSRAKAGAQKLKGFFTKPGNKKKAAKRARPKTGKVPGAKVSQREISSKQLAELKEPKTLTTYALPFMRKGREEPEWRRFTYKQLRQFMNEYKPDDPEGAAEWMSYAVAETWEFESVKDMRAKRSEVQQFAWGERIAMPKGRKPRVKKRTVKKTAKKKRVRK